MAAAELPRGPAPGPRAADAGGTLEPRLGTLTARRFLRRHWQRRPLLVRGAFPGFEDPVGLPELARLACRPEVESRLVLERGGARPWEVVDGPQNAGRLGRLPPRHWTLLVQGVDVHVAGVRRLLEAFSFLPRWRLDDVMVSFAAPRGSVGPHVDDYDVFLLQGHGRRRWGVSAGGDRGLRPGLDLRVLRRFRAEEEWVLEPGDMLYVPPGVAHHGVALSDCLTYSIGFRAPSHAEILAAVWQRIVENAVRGESAPRERLYGDAGLPLQREPGEISAWARRRFRRILDSGARGRHDDLDFALGELLTTGKTEARPAGRALSLQTLRGRLGKGADLEATAASRLAFSRRGRGVLLFANGRSFQLPAELAFAGPLLTRSPRIPNAGLRPHLRQPAFLALLLELLNAGAFRLASSRARPAKP